MEIEPAQAFFHAPSSLRPFDPRRRPGRQDGPAWRPCPGGRL